MIEFLPSKRDPRTHTLVLFTLLPMENGMRPTGNQGSKKCLKTALGGRLITEDSRAKEAAI
jgi:hypothetical protein